jgi:transcriptional regulator with XRE-family HTH domain
MARPPIVRTNIARLRIALSLNQPQFAALIERSVAAVQSLELGRLKLSTDLAGHIAARTGVNTRWLLENNLNSEPYDFVGKPWSINTYRYLSQEIPSSVKQEDEVFRVRMLEVASQLALGRNTASIKRIYRAVPSGGSVVEIGRRIDQFLATIMMEIGIHPDVNMAEEIRFVERETDRKTQNVLRVAGVSIADRPPMRT